MEAICIDLNNVLERNKQVAHMRHVYASSSRTAVWLGPADETTYMAFFNIASLKQSWNQRLENLKRIRIAEEDVDEYTDNLRKVFCEEVPIRYWQAVKALLSRSWFERAWVM